MRKNLAIITSLALFVAFSGIPSYAAYEAATRVATALAAKQRQKPKVKPPSSPPLAAPTPTPAPCAPGTFAFTGNDPQDGKDGNIKTFTANGVSVHASAFSRKANNGQWQIAYLGLYNQGL